MPELVLMRGDDEVARLALDEREVTIQFAVLEGKAVPDELPSGRVVRPSDKGFELEKMSRLPPFSNFRLVLATADGRGALEDAHGKVLENGDPAPGDMVPPAAHVRFTSVPPDVAAVVERLAVGGRR